MATAIPFCNHMPQMYLAMTVRIELEQLKKTVEGYLKEIVQDIDIPPGLLAGLEYSLLAGGKRIRPILCLKAYQLFGGDIRPCLPFACGIEMIHTSSLIHDDLPVMDDDDYRRGVLTNHKVFGEANALLAGDALLIWGGELMVRGAAGLACENVLRASAEVLKATGPIGMVGGQYLDLAGENKELALAALEEIHRRKTGQFIKASITGGAILGGATAAELAILDDFGQLLGLLFQITDDLLDVQGDPKLTGKECGSDMARGKATYPGLLGIARSEEIALATKEKAWAALEPLEMDCSFFLELTDLIYNRQS